MRVRTTADTYTYTVNTIVCAPGSLTFKLRNIGIASPSYHRRRTACSLCRYDLQRASSRACSRKSTRVGDVRERLNYICDRNEGMHSRGEGAEAPALRPRFGDSKGKRAADMGHMLYTRWIKRILILMPKTVYMRWEYKTNIVLFLIPNWWRFRPAIEHSLS